MAEREEISEKVKGYVLDEFLPGEKPDALTESTLLLGSGILDSIATLKLASFLEEEFGIAVEAHEMGENNFGNLGAIIKLVQAKSS